MNTDFLHTRAFRVYLVVAAVACFFAVAIPLVLFLLSEPPAEPGLYDRDPEFDSILFNIKVPYVLIDDTPLSWVPSKELRSRWTQDQINEYWIPTKNIVIEILEKRVEEKVDKIFEAVP